MNIVDMKGRSTTVVFPEPQRLNGHDNKELGCRVVGLSYDFHNHSGWLDLPFGSRCGMQACIQFFERLDPDVLFIQVFRCDDEVARYWRDVPAPWVSQIGDEDG